MMSRSVTIKDVYAFFLPLIFMAEMMMISHSVIHAFLARMENPQQTLAAYSVAFYFHSTLGSPVWTGLMVAISFIKDKRSIARLFWFNGQIALVLFWVWIVAGATPIGTYFFQHAFGLSAELALEVQQATLVLFMVVPLVVVRSLAYALIMVNRRTILVTYGTAVRLLSLAGFLVVLPWFLHGAMVGAAALVSCIGVEALYAYLMARPFYDALPDVEGEPASYGEIWRFSWPIMLVQTAESGVGITINFFLGRLAQPELALASFGVMDGIMRVLLSPLRSLTQTAQTLTRSRADLLVMLRFLVHMTLFFGGAMLLFYVPLVRVLGLRGVMGLPEHIAAYVTPALFLAFLLATTQGSSAMFRGLLIGVRRTGAIAASAGARLGAVVAVGSITFLLPGANGAVVGIIALIAAFGAEGLVLGWRLLSLDRKPQRLFDGAPEAERQG